MRLSIVWEDGPIFPRKNTACEYTVKTDLRQYTEKLIPTHFSFPNIQVLMNSNWSADGINNIALRNMHVGQNRSFIVAQYPPELRSA